MAKCAQFKTHFVKLLLIVVFIILLPVIIDILFKTGAYIGSNIRILTNAF